MNEQSWTAFLLDRRDELVLRLGEHLMLASVSTLIATVLGVAIAILAFQHKPLRSAILAIVGILQTIPGLAMLVLLMTILGRIGVVPSLVALTLYALLPIVRNTLTGLVNVSPTAILAAEGLGMTPHQELRMVRMPLAAPYIMSGIRTAVVIGIGLATLAAFIGGGGLGEFINRGLALSNTRLILLGAVPAALLAVLADLVLAAAEWGIRPAPTNPDEGNFALNLTLRRLSASLPAIFLILSFLIYAVGHNSKNAGNTVRIGTKHFSEQLVLGELMAQMIERHAHLTVDRRFNLGGTMICHGALINNEIDLYPEYTGTSLSAILHLPPPSDPATTLNFVSGLYHKNYQANWLAPFGFDDSWAVIVSESDKKLSSVKTISQLSRIAPDLKAGLTAEFAERADGYPGLSARYDLHFGGIKDLDPNLAYRAVSGHQVDVAAGNSTDGRIAAYHLRVLVDDKKFFPPYQAAPVVRDDLLARHPEVGQALALLKGQIDGQAMQKLNFEVDALERPPAEVVKTFLTAKGLI
jgi:osmoprotectant transport system permease protein